MEYKILQWNIAGFFSHYEEVRNLLKIHNPAVLMIQESHFHLNDDNHRILSGFSFERADDPTALNHRKGGSAIGVRNDFKYDPIPLRTRYQAVAVRLYYPLEFTVCSIYLPPHEDVSETELADLLGQLPAPLLIGGDLNARNSAWRSDRTDRKGQTIETVMTAENLNLLNTGENTHFSAAYLSYSAIDVSYASPILELFFEWTVTEDSMGSDHYPIFMTSFQGGSSDQTRKRWKLKEADWQNFESLISSFCQENPQPSVETFSNAIVAAASQSIPKTKGSSHRPQVPWWSDDIKKSIQARRSAERRCRKNPTQENLIEFRRAQATTRRLIRQSRKKSFQAFIESINRSTPSSVVWRRIRNLSGKTTSPTIRSIQCDDRMETSATQVAEVMGTYFSHICSSDNYRKDFQTFKEMRESVTMQLPSGDDEPYNAPFTMEDLENALKRCRPTSPGADLIHYEMLKRLPPDGKVTLLFVLNEVWRSGELPSSWLHSLVLPMLKKGKDQTQRSSYRPISLTSAICKLLERMICHRLWFILESKKMITPNQFAFRKGLGTDDFHATLESEIHQALGQGQQVLSVFLDLEKAYDRVWTYHVISELVNNGIRGNMLLFLNNFLNNRKLQVSIGGHTSSIYNQEIGLPQGSVLSVPLFLVAINSLSHVLPNDVKLYAYADDLSIHSAGHSLFDLQNNMQEALDAIVEWEDCTGFMISPDKTRTMLFSKKRSKKNDPPPSPILLLRGNRLEQTEAHTVVGLIYDSKLTWRPELKARKAKSQRNLNILRTLGKVTWGADQDMLLQVHQMKILSGLEYGSHAYGSATSTDLKRLNTVNNEGIRIAIGAFRTTREADLLAESGILPLDLRRQKKKINLALKIATNPNHPLHDAVRMGEGLSRRSPKNHQPFTLRSRNLATEYGLDWERVDLFNAFTSPPWSRTTLSIDVSLQQAARTHPSAVRQNFLSHLNSHDPEMTLYTDGSKSPSGVGGAVVDMTSSSNEGYCLPSEFSIYSSELFSIWKAIQRVSAERKRTVIVTDSLSSLQALQGDRPGHPIVAQVLKGLEDLEQSSVTLLWAPGHSGIPGNEAADVLAKNAAEDVQQQLEIRVPAQDWKSILHQNIAQRWHADWIGMNTKLGLVKSSISRVKIPSWLGRKSAVKMTRLRLGHSRLTHSHLFSSTEEPPSCNACGERLTTQHLVLQPCAALEQQMRSCGLTADSIKDMNQYGNIIKYLRELNYFDLL